MTQLVKYEAARHALAEAKAVDEVKNIHDVAAAMKAYARQANDKQLVIDASEIQIRAERRLGEMIRQQKETVGLNQGANGSQVTGNGQEPVRDTRPTLADVGISKKLSSRSQAIAAIPQDEFEDTLAEHREQQQAVTASTMEKLARKGGGATKSFDPLPKKLPKWKPDDADRLWMLAKTDLDKILPEDTSKVRVMNEIISYAQNRINETK